MENYQRIKLERSEYACDLLSFQAVEWQDFNEKEDDNQEEDMVTDDENENPLLHDKSDEKYIIRVFGVDKKGFSVCLTVKDFTPFFYIKVKDSWGKQDTQKFLRILNEKLSKTPKKVGELWVKLDFSKNLLYDKCVLQLKNDFYGFTNKKKYKFLRLVFNNSDAMKKTISIIKNHNNSGQDKRKKLEGFSKLPLYESNLDPIIRFAHIKNLKFSGWIECSDFKFIDPSMSSTTCQIECESNWQGLKGTEIDTNAPILQASYDIETYSIDGKFPSPNIRGNVITQIATSFKYFGSKEFYFKHIVCLKKCSPLHFEDNVPVFMEWYNTEKEVLLAWKRLISKTDPDVLYQYNGDQFDGYYIYNRWKMLNVDEDFSLGKMKNTQATIKESNFSSSAYGSTAFKRLTMPGRINFDILIYIKREYNENSYKLDYVSEKYLGENKNPITASMMFKYFEEGDPDKIRDVAYYCIKDTLLPQKLVDKMHILQNQISMSNVTHVPIRFLIERGQQIKVFSQILRETRQYGYLVPTLDNYGVPEDNEFTGATVLDPLKGAYFEPITICDFASLYPSIIRAHNLCFSTIILDEKFDNLKDVEYETIEWQDDKNGKIVNHKYKFVKNVTGILPKLLSELTLARKNYKNLMKSTEDPFLQEVYNKSQLAVKVSMNSIYGFLAAPMLRCKEIAACVTAIGRNMIKDTKNYMENNYDASVTVYGDSVTKDTPILIRDPEKNMIFIKTINSLGNTPWTNYEEFKSNEKTNRRYKQQCLSKYEVWTDVGWSKIKRVIRHFTNKNIYKVMSDYGYVQVTEDHSLLNPNLKVIKPLDCNKKTKLLFSYPENYDSKLIILKKSQAFMYGLFDSYNNNYNNTMQFNIDIIMNSTIEVKLAYMDGFILNHENTTKNEDFIISSIRCYDSLFCSKLYFVLSCLYGRNIRIDFEYLNNNSDDISYNLFLPYDPDGVIEDPGDYDNNVNSISLMNTSINYRNNVENQYINVYDLETECGRFQAGIGQNIIKNTDSVFIKFKTETTDKYNDAMDNRNLYTPEHIQDLKTKCIKESIELGKIASKNATQDLFKFPINLEYEKVYHPLLLLSKKRYIGNLYSDDPSKMEKMDNKGVVLKRRDNFTLLKKTYRHVIDILMDKGKTGIDEVIEYIQNILYQIINNDFDDINDFVISKSLKDNHKSKNIPHVILAEKIKQRDPNNYPKSNDRVPYVFTKPDVREEIGKKWMKDIEERRRLQFIEKVSEKSTIKIKSFEDAVLENKKLTKKILFKKGKLDQYEKVEDPEFVVKNKLNLDAEYYINFMKIPVCEILSLFIDNPEHIFDEIIQEWRETLW